MVSLKGFPQDAVMNSRIIGVCRGVAHLPGLAALERAEPNTVQMANHAVTSIETLSKLPLHIVGIQLLYLICRGVAHLSGLAPLEVLNHNKTVQHVRQPYDNVD